MGLFGSVVAVNRWEVLGFGVLLGLLLVGTAVLVDRVAHRAARGTLGRNAVAGIRSSATMESDEAWLAAHQAGEILTRLGAVASGIGGLAAIAVGVMTAMDSLTPNRGMLLSTIAIAASCGVMTVLVMLGAWRGQRAARRVNSQ